MGDQRQEASVARGAVLKGSLRRLWRYVRPELSSVLLAALCIAANAALTVAIVGMSERVLRVDTGDASAAVAAELLQQVERGTLSASEARAAFSTRVREAERQARLEALRNVGQAVQIILILAAANLFFAFGGIYFANRASLRVVRTLRAELFAHLHELSMSFFDRARAGELASGVINDTTVIQHGLTLNLRDMITAPATVIVGGIWMFWLSWQLSLAAVVLVPTISAIIYVLGLRSRRLMAAMQGKVARLQAVLYESLAGMSVVKCFNLEARELERFGQENQETYRAGMRVARVDSLLFSGSHFIGTIGFVLIIWFGTMLILRQRLQFSELIAVALITQRVGASLTRGGRAYNVLQQIGGIADRIFALLDQQPDIVERPDAQPLEVGEGRVEYEHVSFAYNEGEQVLEDITFTIEPGQVVAVVGPSGSGKSTLANLLPRLYDPTRGRILINGQDISRVTLSSLRAHIGVVQQETFLFSGTVRENILLGRPDATEEEMIAAARAADAHEFIMSFEGGYDALVGERGVTLSGGQRQRIAIARALLKDPKILVLDEATSALDAESEAVVQRALEVLMKNRTTLIIAHRLSTIRHADQILVLQNGKIVERGTHDELMKLGGVYAALYRRQVEEEPVAAS